jgi:hypothetical protein
MAKKKKFIVLARRGDVGEKGLITGKGHRKFYKDSAMWISDPAEAREIEQKYKGKVSVTEDQQYTWSVNNEGADGTKLTNIHKYTFQGVDTTKFVKPKEGQRKIFSGVEYRRAMVGGKWQWIPIENKPKGGGTK